MNDKQPTYKRGTFRKDGKLYGRYPDGTPYRIYTNTDNQFLRLINNTENGLTMLRVRQATEQGYAEVPPWSVCDLAYPTSQLRRARTVGGGQTGERADLRTTACGVRGMGINYELHERHEKINH